MLALVAGTAGAESLQGDVRGVASESLWEQPGPSLGMFAAISSESGGFIDVAGGTLWLLLDGGSVMAQSASPSIFFTPHPTDPLTSYLVKLDTLPGVCRSDDTTGCWKTGDPTTVALDVAAAVEDVLPAQPWAGWQESEFGWGSDFGTNTSPLTWNHLLTLVEGSSFFPADGVTLPADAPFALATREDPTLRFGFSYLTAPEPASLLGAWVALAALVRLRSGRRV